ncbi:MAG: Uncharacterized protein G01um101466_722 [Parcubacteria group bacterium Gr01-1014_66]|nr:MAG: Uncharacterized protein G01um101466_722 [Parcubacteria group bacterium Gr01-1014_66]
MTQETRTCQNCKNPFQIDPEDFAFYEKIKVPPPTFCPQCRMQRRMVWRNDKTLYIRKDDHTGKDIFSMFSDTAPITVWDHVEWWSDSWDAMEYGKDIDWSRPFLEQVKELIREVPWASRAVHNLVRSDYCNNASDLKDCYLVFGSVLVENSAYCLNISHSKDCFDCGYVGNGELSYEGFLNLHCYRAIFSSHCASSNDILFCRDCIGVSNCFGCVGLRGKSYYIFNEPYSKEKYEEKVKSFDLASHKKLQEMKERVRQFWLRYPVRYVHEYHNVNTTGEYIYESRNVKDSFHIKGGENLRYCQYLYTPTCRDSYDHFRYGLNSELVYESVVCGDNASQLRFCYDCRLSCLDFQYCLNSYFSSYLFGCVGIRSKSYCILNTQYSKEEYEALVPKIIAHMNAMPYTDRNGRVYRYGEFFPPEFSPFAYNETVAHDHFPLTQEEARAAGYEWKEAEKKNHSATRDAKNLPDRIADVSDDVLKDTIACVHNRTCGEQCTVAFRLIPTELTFYRKMNLPLPRLCPNCRHAARIQQRNPIQLWQRTCQCAGAASENGVYQNQVLHSHGATPCQNEFETSYAPGRQDIVYCKSCYQNEIT